MLEALIHARGGGAWEKGDFIALRLDDSGWGSRELVREPDLEKRTFLVVKWEDPFAEQLLRQMREDGEPHPSIAYPYKSEKGQFSTKQMDVERLPDPKDVPDVIDLAKAQELTEEKPKEEPPKDEEPVDPIEPVGGING